MSAITLDAGQSVEAWSGKDRGEENFPVGSLLIRAALRPHIHAYYNFARNADDIADSPLLGAEEKVARLDHMEAVLRGNANTGSPSALKLRASLAETGLSSGHATDLLIAFRQDATKHRYRDWDELLEYCRYSAMPVGRHVLDLHGEDAQTHPPSDALCAALQVLNHIQDCQKDLQALDRCYLPEDWLRRFGGSVEDLHNPAETPALRGVFNLLLHEVDILNTKADALPRRVRSRRLRLETGVILGLSRRLARRLRNGDPLAMRVKLTKTDVAAALLGALRFP
jgi:farnesyl-diphosphate farnesyltransferase